MTQEDELLRKNKNGDGTCLDELVTIYYSDIFRYCLWHTSSRQAAEDATQETFLKIIRYFDTYIHHGKFKAYIYKVASNVCVDLWRKKEAEALPEDLLYIEAGFEQTEFDVDMIRLVQKLPKEQREIILLRFAQDLSIREIAEVENIPLRTAQSRLRAALKQIKKSINAGGKKRE
ncbi:RNA polymerase sigma factor [Clostridium oryzae]|uniref:ECF RNA polymerase sigma factor SigW n=1 Tax=Clostridium oryzae TaxID=1450648 RepID=A0A1V4IS38_9CLOT|nr:RNA polymerase sigma factor [Clostridium oryzae]OPJ62267.1 ECF RNA polymerase sigma factor SigW [Clostridium oryzae]